MPEYGAVFKRLHRQYMSRCINGAQRIAVDFFEQHPSRSSRLCACGRHVKSLHPRSFFSGLQSVSSYTRFLPFPGSTGPRYGLMPARRSAFLLLLRTLAGLDPSSQNEFGPLSKTALAPVWTGNSNELLKFVASRS